MSDDDQNPFSESERPEDGPAFKVTSVAEPTWNSDNEQPSAGGRQVLSEDERPVTDPVYAAKRKRPPTHDQSTRRGLALVVLLPTVAFYAFAVLAFVCHWIKQDDLTATVAAISPFQALAAAVIGFYFAKRDDDPR